jgi:serine/threonine-protein kinase
MAGRRAASEATLQCPHCGEAHPRDAKACPMTGRPMPGAFVPGQVLEGKYRIVQHIADGGMGAVYEAEHLTLGKRVAIKTLHPDLSKNEDLVLRLQKEAVAASAIGHEHIVEIHDLGRTADKAVFIVMELLKGQNLAERLKAEGGLLLVGRAAHIVKQVVAALSSAHKNGIIHRDLKPENIYLIQRRQDPDFVKVLDFGTAKLMADSPDAKLESTGFVLGTPYYMAPEQARGGAVDHRVDIYACGALLYHMVTGRVPFEAPNFNALMFEIASGRYAPPRAIVPDIPAAFEQIIQWAMALDPAQRFQTAEQFLQAITPYAQVTGGVPALGSPKSTIPHSAVPTLVLEAMNQQQLRELARPTRARHAPRSGALFEDEEGEEAQTTVHPENPYLKESGKPGEAPPLPPAPMTPSPPSAHETLPTVPGKARTDLVTAQIAKVPGPAAGKAPTPAQQARTVPMMEAQSPPPQQPLVPQPQVVPHQVASVPVQPIPHQPGPMPAMHPVPPGALPQMQMGAPMVPGMSPPQYPRSQVPIAPGPPPGAQMVSQPPRPYPLQPGQSPAAVRAAMHLPAHAALATHSGRTGPRRYESTSKSVIITVIVGVIVELGLGGGIIWFVRYQRARAVPRATAAAPQVTVKNQPGVPEVGSRPVRPSASPGTTAPAPSPPPETSTSTPEVRLGATRVEATLTFDVSPPEAARVAEIRVDDRPVGGMRHTVSVKPGQKVRVVVKASGFASYDHRVGIEGDTTITVRLKQRSEPEPGNRPRPEKPDKPDKRPTGPGGSVGDL